MTSVAVIRSAVAKINRFKGLHNSSESLPDEADALLKDLGEIEEHLLAAYDRRTGEGPSEAETKEVVRLSYDVVDVIADSFKPASVLGQYWKKSGTTKLQELHAKLKGFQDELTGNIKMDWGSSAGSESPATGPESSPGRKKAGRDNKLKGGLIQRKISSGSAFLGDVISKIPSKLKTKKSGDMTGLESQASGEQVPDGLDEIPESASTDSEIQAEDDDGTSLLDRLRNDLMSELPEGHSREVLIVGKSGSGKSSLARKLYNDLEIQMCFDVFGWVSVVRNFQIKGVLQLLLQQLGQKQQLEVQEMDQIGLISHIFDAVKDKSYLLVLDDIAALEDWESIRLALPLANSSRVIITTSSRAFPRGDHHYSMTGLSRLDIGTLLNQESSFDMSLHRVLVPEVVVDAIYKISGGSPLFATILGKSLLSEAANEQRLADELLRCYLPHKGTPKVLGASYTRLDPQLKPCFLYLGQFPPGQDIRFDKLHRLLAAENLIPSPELLARYLDELAKLKLVEVEEDVLSETGLHKCCRLHEQVRDFCRFKGLDEEFFEIVDFERSKQVVGLHERRLAIYMRNYKGEKSSSIQFLAAKKVSSLVIFDSFESALERSGWPSEMSDLSDFSHLKVLSFDEVSFKARKLPKGLEKLLLLTFLSFRGCFLEEFPPFLSSLTQLKTLDLLVRDECDMVVADDVFNSMNRLVHLYLPRKYRGNGKGKVKLRGSEAMETLVNLDTEVFDLKDLSQLKRLKILSTVSKGQNPEEIEAVIDLLNDRGEELQHSSMAITGFDCYNRASVSALKKLLRCRFVRSVHVEGQIGELPAEGGGGRVSEMVLHGSDLELDPMDYLGRFQNLRSLVLADDAFMGTEILISSSSPFPELRSLKLRKLQYLEKLRIEKEAVPKLSSLQIESCGRALELTVPEELYNRLKYAIGGDAYSVVPSPSKLYTTT